MARRGPSCRSSPARATPQLNSRTGHALTPSRVPPPPVRACHAAGGRTPPSKCITSWCAPSAVRLLRRCDARDLSRLSSAVRTRQSLLMTFGSSTRSTMCVAALSCHPHACARRNAPSLARVHEQLSPRGMTTWTQRLIASQPALASLPRLHSAQCIGSRAAVLGRAEHDRRAGHE